MHIFIYLSIQQQVPSEVGRAFFSLHSQWSLKIIMSRLFTVPAEHELNIDHEHSLFFHLTSVTARCCWFTKQFSVISAVLYGDRWWFVWELTSVTYLRKVTVCWPFHCGRVVKNGRSIRTEDQIICKHDIIDKDRDLWPINEVNLQNACDHSYGTYGRN